MQGLNYSDSCARACIAAINIRRAIKEFILLQTVNNGTTIELSSDEEVVEISGVSSSRLSRPRRRTLAIGLRGVSKKSHATGLDTLMLDSQSEDFDLPIHIGTATGAAFVAIVGDEKTKIDRLDIGQVGDAYNRAKALLSLAQAEFGKVFVDSQTMRGARAHLDVKYHKHIDLRNRFFNVPVFEPTIEDPLDQFAVRDKNAVNNVKHLFKKFESDFVA